MIIPKYTISTLDPKNNYIMLMNNEIASIKHIFQNKNGDIYLNVCTFNYSNLFNIPISSEVISTFVIDLSSNFPIRRIQILDIKFKCFVIEMSNNKAIAMILGHNIF